MAVRAVLAVVGSAALIAVIVGGVIAIKPDGAPRILRAGADPDPGAGSAVAQGVAASKVPAPAGSAPAFPAATTGPATRATQVALVPTMAEGRRELGDSMYAIREGAQVTVHFDLETMRTRFDWKFEGIVRATLPLVFGEAVRVAMDSIPVGTWVRGGAMLVDLPARGIPLKLGDQSLRVWPVTREGRDGPLVIGYRASADR